jgi:hypothetical protein
MESGKTVKNKRSLSNKPRQRRRGLYFTWPDDGGCPWSLRRSRIRCCPGTNLLGKIFGNLLAGDTVVATNLSICLQRDVKSDSKGGYSLRALLFGGYNIVLKRNRKTVIQRLNVLVVVDRGIKVDFDCAKYKCAAQ